MGDSLRIEKSRDQTTHTTPPIHTGPPKQNGHHCKGLSGLDKLNSHLNTYRESATEFFPYPRQVYNNNPDPNDNFLPHTINQPSAGAYHATRLGLGRSHICTRDSFQHSQASLTRESGTPLGEQNERQLHTSSTHTYKNLKLPTNE